MKTTLAVVYIVERTGTTYCTIVNGMDSPQYIADEDLTTDDKNPTGSLRYELYNSMHVYTAILSFVVNNIDPPFQLTHKTFTLLYGSSAN